MHQSHFQTDSVGGSKQSARTHSTLLSRNEKRQRSSSSFTSTSHDHHHAGGFGIVVRPRSQKSASPIVNQHRHHQSNEGNLSTHRRVSRKTRSELRQGQYAFEGRNSGHSRSLDAYTAHLLAHAQTADEHEPMVNTDNVKHLVLQSADIGESGCMNPIHGKRMRKRQRQRLVSAVQSKRCLTQRDANIPESLLENLLGIDAMEVLTSLQSGPGPFSSSPTVQSQSPRPGWVTPFQHNCLRSLASMLVCPHTVVPITVGLFSRSPGMNENIYLQTLSDEIAVLTSINPYHIPGNRIKFNFSASLLPLLIVLLTGYLLGLTLGWQLGLAVALTGSLLYAIVCCIIFYGVRAKRTPNWIQFSETLSRYMRGCYLLLNILFCRVPPVSNIAQPVKLLPISLDVSNCVSAINAVALMTEKLWMYMEQKYGKLAVRMQWASKDVYDDSCQTYRKCCCLPLWLWFTVYLASSLSLATLLAVPRQSKTDLRSAVQATPQSKPGSKSLVSDAYVSHNWMHITAITCGVLAGISLFVLIVAACPSLINLIRGRPFQRGAQRMRWKDDGKLHEPLFDECYSRATGMFDPTCMRKNGGVSIERCMMCPRECAFHLHSDLDSTVTSTAAANQWRSTVRSNREKKADLGGKSEWIRTSLDVEHRNDVSKSDAAVDDFSESSPLTEEDENDEFSSEEQDEIKHVEESETCIHSEPVLFNSGEELIPNLNKCKATSLRDTSNDLSGKNRKATEAKTLARWKKVIKKGLLEGCKCLSMIDARAGGRQTRVIISITGTGVPFVQVDPLGKLSALIRLIDKLLMQPPGGGTSGDVNLVSKPFSSNDHTKDPSNLRRIREAVPNQWTPNVIVLLTASVPTSDATKQHISNAPDGLPPEFRRPSLLDASIQWSNFKVWWSIHHYCHLPIYIEEQPPGFFVNEASERRQLFEHCGGFTISPFTKLPPDSTLLNLYAETHELAILNRKHLRHLLTMTAFVGRMIILDRLLTWQNNSLCGRPHCFLSLGDLDWCVNALVTWLCLVKHWPFHAAWLAIFIEEQLRSDENVSRVELHRTGSQKSRNLPEDSQSFPDVRLSTSNLHGTRAATLSMETTLSQLHLRVLKRLAFAVEAARQKALSASVIATEHGDGDSRRPIQMYSPRVISTLEMCNLALRDRNPRRLAEFLQHSEKDRFSDADCHEAPRTCSPFDAGQVTVGHLLRIMKLTPFLNPHISAWIRDISSTKHISTESVNEEKSNSGKQPVFELSLPA
ncbi:unnamed protein product [Dicrocoelium dendriticum]|nr:unnamed protein product [Dicrocoelium dendriticum]